MSKKKELQNRQIAQFALSRNYNSIGRANSDQLKKHLLDSLGSLFNSLMRPAIQKFVLQYGMMGENGKCEVPLIGTLPYDRAAQFYTALIRYPDFMDNFLGKEATCHPSDNIGPLLAASYYRPITGKDFLAALGIAYEIECRLVEEIPVMKEGIDHTLILAYSIVSSISRLFELSKEQTAHALGIAGCSVSPLVTSRASYTYEWKGFASSFVALGCVNTTLLAKQGMTGPIELFEGPKGFRDIFGMKLDFDWDKDQFELIRKCVLKSYNAEVHTQPAIEAALEIINRHRFSADDIERIDVTTFLTAYHITGSGLYGDRKTVKTKEQADHSLFYVVAVALLDGEIYPEQFEPERINRSDVQELLKKIFVHTQSPIHEPLSIAGILDPYTISYPDKVKAKVDITLTNGKKYGCEKEDYHGFFTRPLDWEIVVSKFRRLSSVSLESNIQDQIIGLVGDLENHDMSELLQLIAHGAGLSSPVSLNVKNRNGSNENIKMI
jgi:2-methylcitrate dehydratase